MPRNEAAETPKKRKGASKAQVGRIGATVSNGISQEETARFEAQVTELRNAGASWPKISEATGRALSSCYEAYQRVLRSAMSTETRQEAVTAAVLRAERLRLAVWQQALAGDPKAVKSALDIDRHLAALLGLNAPVRVEHVEITVDDLMADLDRFLQAETAQS